MPLPGNPDAVLVASRDLASAAEGLAQTHDAVVVRGRSFMADWSGRAAPAAVARIEQDARTVALTAEAISRAVAPLERYADDLRRAQLDYARGEQMLLDGRAAFTAAGSGAAAGTTRTPMAGCTACGSRTPHPAARSRARQWLDVRSRGTPRRIALTDNYDPRAEILWSGTDDWVSLAEAAAIVADERDIRQEVVRVETLKILAGLLRDGLIQAGEVINGFHPWGLDEDETMRRIEERCSDPSQRLTPFEGTWFANTDKGEALAHELADAGLTSKPSGRE